MARTSRLGTMGAYLSGLREHLRRPLSAEDCRAIAALLPGQREADFLALIERLSGPGQASPLRRLLEHAGATPPEVEALVRAEGLEGALERLHAAGVYVSLDEFKGRTPIVRGSLRLDVRPADFDSPFSAAAFGVTTGGSRSAGLPVSVSFALLAYEGAIERIFLEAVGALERPYALLRPAPPGGAGIKNILRRSSLGLSAQRWFTPTPPFALRTSTYHAALTAATLALGRLWCRPIPWPRFVPPERPGPILDWLAHQAAAGRPAHFDAPASVAARLCARAVAGGWKIAGTFFRVGGEPLTPAKIEQLQSAGCSWAVYYSMTEIGRIGMACTDGEALDDVHVLTGKLALIERPALARGADLPDGLFLTALHPAAPKLMLNVELGDYAQRHERRCACPLGAAGYVSHLHTIRSYEKLTAAGMHFLGSGLIRLLEERLAPRFGGAPDDFQFVEGEEQGVTHVIVRVHPRLGPLDEAALTGAVLEGLKASAAGERMMADIWRRGGTLRVERRPPELTRAGKVLPLVAAGNHSTRSAQR